VGAEAPQRRRQGLGDGLVLGPAGIGQDSLEVALFCRREQRAVALGQVAVEPGAETGIGTEWRRFRRGSSCERLSTTRLIRKLPKLMPRRPVCVFEIE